MEKNKKALISLSNKKDLKLLLTGLDKYKITFISSGWKLLKKSEN